jgi:hypothetical protein
VHKKKKEQTNKEPSKNQPLKPKLADGVDEDILLFSEVDLRIS